jgi:MFS family permease
VGADVSILSRMTRVERRATQSLAIIYALRMLGLFMILPVFALFAEDLPGSTPVLVGLVMGIYGLTQACLQIPFGMLSDRVGRKPVMIGGLVLFAVGSVVAATGESIGVVLLGRALQGAGAIAAVVMALAADLTREEQRTKVMASIGMSIGMSFMIAMVAGPILNQWIGVPGIFGLTAVLAVLGIAVVIWVVPTPKVSRVHRDAQTVPAQLKGAIADSSLLRLDLGIFSLHFVLMSSFLVLPLILKGQFGFAPSDHWQLYLSVLVLSVFLMVPFVILAEKYHQMKKVFVGAVLMIALSQFILFFIHSSFWSLACVLLLFFIAFNLLESVLPSLISKIAPAQSKGTAMGVYSTSQFFGTFLGGLLGGVVHQQFNLHAVFILNACVATVWLIVAFGMKNPRYLSNYLLNVGELDEQHAAHLQVQLTQVRGVAEVVIMLDEGVAYLKVDKRALDLDALLAFSKS